MSKFLTHTICNVHAIVELNAPGLRERKYVGVNKVNNFFQNMPNFEGRDIICLVHRYALFTSTRNVFNSKIKKVEFQFKVIPIKRLKFIYSEKATKFCEISTVDLTVTT